MYLRKIVFPLLLIAAGVACNEKNTPVLPPDSGGVSVTLKSESSFPFGAALSIAKMKSSNNYSTTVRNEFSSVTAENAMKMVNIVPVKDQYAWADADYLVNFAVDNGVRVHGHCLVWHQSNPAWLSSYIGTKEEWKALLRNYITVVVGRYKGRIASWDVVNEILLDDGTPRPSIWFEKIGWEYVDIAFAAAHAADPDAVLFYNEYGQEYSQVKLRAVNDSVRAMILRGVPVHGVGLQMHTNINQLAENMVRAITETAKTGLKVHVSELDIAVNRDKKSSYVLTDADLNTQSSRYRTVTAAMKQLPQEQNWGITTWGVSDADSWLTPNPDYPLLFDKQFKRKPCYNGVLEALSLK